MAEGNHDSPQDHMLHVRYVRWQTVTREQLGYALNLLLGLAAAAIAFELTLIVNPAFILTITWEKCSFLSSLSLLTVSMLLGLIATVTRLWDFRLTSRLVRKRWKEPEQTTFIAKLECCTERLGKITWRLFWGQAATFGAGVALAGMVFIVLSKAKYFG